MKGEKQGIEKMLEESEELIKKTVWGNICRDCSGGGADGEELCKKCGGCGIVDWQGTDELKSFLRSAIETAFKEVSTADFSRQTARIFKNEEHQRGYIAALSDYDQAVDKYLGK